MSALETIKKALSGLTITQPFYATLALHLELVEDSKEETFWTDGARMGFNPAFVAELKLSEIMAVCAHEVSHCARLHHIRRGDRDPDRWNEACDYSINGELKAAGFNLPEGALLRPEFDMLSEEEIYSRLTKEQESQQGGKQGQEQPQPAAGQQQANGKPQSPAQGQQAGNNAGQPSPGNGQAQGKGAAMGKVKDAPGNEASAAESEREWRANVRQAIGIAKAMGAGKLPGHLQQIDEITAAPRFNWKEELRRYVDQSMIKLESWDRPNRRFIAEGLYLPGMISDALAHAVYIADDSSSIDMAVYTAGGAEMKAALDEGAADRLTVVHCNVAVHKVETFERGDDFNLTARGSGGTRFSPAFEYVANNIPDASVIVYCTDLGCTDFGPEPACPVLWLAYGERAVIAKRAARVPFGEIIHVAA
jgi:predicted metal-dependent peptidase